jgi:hypothetical protein
LLGSLAKLGQKRLAEDKKPQRFPVLDMLFNINVFADQVEKVRALMSGSDFFFFSFSSLSLF